MWGEAPQSPVPAAQPVGATWPILKSSQKGCEWKGWEIITEEAQEGGGEAGERLNETANALVIPACSGRRRQTAMLPAPATESARRDGLGMVRRQQ